VVGPEEAADQQWFRLPQPAQTGAWLTFSASILSCVDSDEFRRVAFMPRANAQAKWSVAVAVGERAFLEVIEAQTRSYQQMLIGQEGGNWDLRKEYGAVSGPKNWAMSLD
jgi:hypothetical protein